jgi:hypothetical protein
VTVSAIVEEYDTAPNGDIVLVQAPGLEGHLDDAEDRDGDKYAHGVNPKGFNKQTGDGRTAASKLVPEDGTGGSYTVKSPGYVTGDSYLGADGHYYIGQARRRVGAGFGRRRAPHQSNSGEPGPSVAYNATDEKAIYGDKINTIFEPYDQQKKDDEDGNVGEHTVSNSTHMDDDENDFPEEDFEEQANKESQAKLMGSEKAVKARFVNESAHVEHQEEIHSKAELYVKNAAQKSTYEAADKTALVSDEHRKEMNAKVSAKADEMMVKEIKAKLDASNEQTAKGHAEDASALEAAEEKAQKSYESDISTVNELSEAEAHDESNAEQASHEAQEIADVGGNHTDAPTPAPAYALCPITEELPTEWTGWHQVVGCGQSSCAKTDDQSSLSFHPDGTITGLTGSPLESGAEAVDYKWNGTWTNESMTLTKTYVDGAVFTFTGTFSGSGDVISFAGTWTDPASSGDFHWEQTSQALSMDCGPSEEFEIPTDSLPPTEAPASPTPAPCESNITVTSESCEGDDCLVEARCPSNMKLHQCQTVPHNSGDGAFIKEVFVEDVDQENYVSCVAQGAGGRGPIQAEATCVCNGGFQTVASSGEMYLDKQTVTAECIDGSRPISCNCRSSWKVGVCGNEASWDPVDGIDHCTKIIGSSGGRRRGVGGGAGAKIYALCEDTAPSPPPTIMPTPEPTTSPTPEPTTVPPTVTDLDLADSTWSQYLEDHMKCEKTAGTYGLTQAECQAQAEAAGHDYYSYKLVDERSGDMTNQCFTSADCSSPLSNTANVWKIYHYGPAATPPPTPLCIPVITTDWSGTLVSDGLSYASDWGFTIMPSASSTAAASTGTISGSGSDTYGAFVWSGSYEGAAVNATKQYPGAYSLHFTGTIDGDASGQDQFTTTLSGSWIKEPEACVQLEATPSIVSQGKPTSMSSDGGYGTQGASSNAVDGNTNSNWGGKSCTHTANQDSPWWSVDLQDTYKVEKVTVYNRGDCCGTRLNNFYVSVGTAEGTSTGAECGTGANTIASGGSTDVACGGIEGSFVTVSKKDTVSIQICEVEVWAQGCGKADPDTVSEVAQGKPASMSSTSQYHGPASNAVDGNTNSAWGGGSCTHTNSEQGAWWAVDLQDTYNVATVEVYNRGDCCGSRLNNFYVEVSGQECGSGANTIAQGGTASVTCNLSGNSVKISKKDTTSIQICEVKVYASNPCTSETTHTSDGCSGDDCYTKVSCPAGTHIKECNTLPANSADGAFINEDLECVAQGSGGGGTIQAQVACSCDAQAQSVSQSSANYLDQQTVTASCPAGSAAASCNCRSAWKIGVCNSAASFAPVNGVCSAAIGTSGGRRRGVGSGAGAQLTALCQELGDEGTFSLTETNATNSCDDPNGEPATSSPTPPPTAPELAVRVTTGNIDYAESDMAPQVIITGSSGSFTGTFTTGNAKGAVQVTSFQVDSDIGEVQNVAIKGENSNGWYFTKFEVKSGGRDWQEVGCTDMWLDGEIDSGTYDGKNYGTHHEMTPVSTHCTAATPEAWGLPTATGCFCKMSGTSGTCALNGDSQTWCRTQDSCIGHQSGNGNWDYCTPSATMQALYQQEDPDAVVSELEATEIPSEESIVSETR